ncbi:hypothetical protein K470DRAFT_268740 [Piedraia hortae CBS 480.64]|uniref:Zn(2)-C6 fungal-type domain-containing protein n=1 Tax=Piedraia hortae CBS 480.64 TaxID=1314780 RepID=A0A6A7C6C0_9PEZI|nr:hypothetical protein K470DRAFT_268740 [Piedraia hortae CBS 480.64]
MANNDIESYHQLAPLTATSQQNGYPPPGVHAHPGEAVAPADEHTNGTKRKNDHVPQQRAKRNRYITIACNECKRRKIRCNGNTPCQRCNNLNLECVYAPNCCTGFKDSPEYKMMTEQMDSLQQQVNLLYSDLTSLRTQLNHPSPHMGQHMQAQLQAQMQPAAHAVPTSHAADQIVYQSTAIDPSLQAERFAVTQAPSSVAGAMSPTAARPKNEHEQYGNGLGMETQGERPTGTNGTDENERWGSNAREGRTHTTSKEQRTGYPT